MASDDALSPCITTVALFFFLLLLIQTTATEKEYYNNNNNTSLQPSPNIKDHGETMRRQNLGNSKAHHSNTLINTVHDRIPQMGQKRGRFGARRSSPLMAETRSQEKKFFNASVHEVPSGPNPISNR